MESSCMTHEMMKSEYRGYYAYSDWLTVAEAKKTGLIPKAFHEYFHDHCECGAENIISPNASSIECCDVKCPVKQSYALAELFSRFDCQDVGPATCAQVLQYCRDKFEYNSYVEALFAIERGIPLALEATAAGQRFLDAVYKVRTTPCTFPQMIGNLGIPEFGTSAVKIFSGYNSAEQLLTAIATDGGLVRFCYNRGIEDKRKIFYLYCAMRDILLGEEAMSHVLRKQGMRNVPICITGAVSVNGVHYTRKEFVQLCNRVSIDSDGVALYEFTDSSAIQSVSYIVADSPSNSRKYLAGKSREAAGEKVLITADDLIKLIKERVAIWETEKKNSIQN